MIDDSFSRKLSELFDLYKSGALTEEEYESLKSEIINQGGIKKEFEEKVSAESEHSGDKKHEDSPDHGKPPKVESTKKAHRGRGVIVLISLLVISLTALVIILIIPGESLAGAGKKNNPKEDPVKDIDGNIYNTVTIGTQTWMTENLRTTKYNDGSQITLVTDSVSWAKLNTPAYCWYNNDENANKESFGALYNWYSVETNKLCPAGWHVPTNEEWTILEEYLTDNGFGYEGSGNDIAKSIAAASGWLVNDTAGNVGNDQSSNNRSGFTASQGGYRFSYGSFLYKGSYGKWWSSTETSKTSAFIRFIFSESSVVNSYANQKRNGFSVRCIKDSDETPYRSGTDENIVSEITSDVWDEASARGLILEALENHQDWSLISFRDSAKLIHSVQFLPPIKYESKESVIGIAYSDYEDNYCPDCMGVLSVFEFENRGGWRIVKQALAFANKKPAGEIGWYKISADNYAISVSNIFGTMGEIYQTMGLYAFIKDEITYILDIDHMGNVEDYYNYEIKRSTKYDEAGYSYLLVEEKEKYEDSDTVITKTVYAFNGGEYEKFEGAITDPSLTSISRFYDINSVRERDDNICPTCHGTGIQVCNLCGGTGVNNMGIECGCVRTYKMEIAAGHTPSHPPLQWTCPACGGTGKYHR
jgi:uncharacterized protein (TIGR02145 family)